MRRSGSTSFAGLGTARPSSSIVTQPAAVPPPGFGSFRQARAILELERTHPSDGGSMAGHSHFKNMAHRKGIVDAKRGILWSKLSRAIIIAAKHGGGDPAANLKLRYAIDKAREVSMPKDNIERAIKKGTGELGGESLDEVTYEGYAPGGVAILVETLTDNRSRTNGEIRRIFDKFGGKLGTPGSVAYLFD